MIFKSNENKDRMHLKDKSTFSCNKSSVALECHHQTKVWNSLVDVPTLLTTYQMLTSVTLNSFIAVSSSFVSLLNEQSAVLSKQLETGGLRWYGNTSLGIFNSSASLAVYHSKSL